MLKVCATNNNNYSLIFIFLIGILLLTGCSSSASSKSLNIEENVKKAEEYYKNGKFEEAVKIYDNLYAKTDDTSYLDTIDKIKKDQEVIQKVIDFRETLKDIVENKVRKGMDVNIHDLKVVTEDLLERIDEFDNIELGESHVAFDYVKSIKDSDSYYYLSRFTKKEYDNFLKEPLDPISNTGHLANTLTISIFRDDIYGTYIPEILEIEIPDELSNIES